MDAERFHFILPHGGEGKRAVGNNRKRCAIGRVNRMQALAIHINSLHIGEIFQTEAVEVAARLGLFRALVIEGKLVAHAEDPEK